MTIPRNDQLKAALLAKMQSNPTIVALLSASSDIKENQWQGKDFIYPAVRIYVFPKGNLPTEANCNFSTIMMGINIFSEQDSSQECDYIAGIIGNELHTQSFTSLAITFTGLIVKELNPAIRIDDRTWQANIVLIGTASG